MGTRRGERGPVGAVYAWVRQQSAKAKMALGTLASLLSLAALWILICDHSHFFVASDAIHASSIIVLIYKLNRQKTCSGLTRIFLTVRLYCSVIIEKDLHTVLDLQTLLSTIWVIYMMRFKLNSSYTKELDNMLRYYLLIPAVVLAIFVHHFLYKHLAGFLWAFILESLSALHSHHSAATEEDALQLIGSLRLRGFSLSLISSRQHSHGSSTGSTVAHACHDWGFRHCMVCMQARHE